MLVEEVEELVEEVEELEEQRKCGDEVLIWAGGLICDEVFVRKREKIRTGSHVI